MSDPTNFLVDYDILLKRYQHLGLFSSGQDPILGIRFTNHLMKEKFTQEKCIMQIHSQLSQETLQKKIDQFCKACYQYYVPHYQTIQYLSFVKNGERSYDFIVFYKFDSEDKSLLEMVQNHQFDKNDLQLLYDVLIESVYFGGRLSFEYLDIRPQNIYISKNPTRKIYISNLAQFVPQKMQCLVNYNQSLYQKKDSFFQHILFQIGMVLLFAASQENNNDLYDDKDNIIKQKLETKLNSLKVDTELHQVIQKLLQNFEDKNLLQNLIENQKSKNYFQGELQNAIMYSGFVKDDMAHGVGDIFSNNKTCYKGSFKNNQYDGFGIWHDGLNKFILGQWSQGIIKSGILIQNNQYIYEGNIDNENKEIGSGKGSLVNTMKNTLDEWHFFEGTFEKGQPVEGKCFSQNKQFSDQIPSLDYEKHRQHQSVNNSLLKIFEQKQK